MITLPLLSTEKREPRSKSVPVPFCVTVRAVFEELAEIVTASLKVEDPFETKLSPTVKDDPAPRLVKEAV
jgi:hypothetical protein